MAFSEKQIERRAFIQSKKTSASPPYVLRNRDVSLRNRDVRAMWIGEGISLLGGPSYLIVL